MGYWSEPGWKGTRAAGVLNFLLAGNPEMTYGDVINWAGANGLPDWLPSTDPNDQEQYKSQVGIDGSIVWDDNYPYPSNWSQIFKEWQAGTWVVAVPQPPVNTNILASQVAEAAAAVVAVAPAPVPEIIIEPAQPAPMPVAIPESPAPTSYTPQPQVNPAAPNPLEIMAPQQVQPAPVAPSYISLPAIEPVATIYAPAPGGILEGGDGALIKIALGLLLL